MFDRLREAAEAHGASAMGSPLKGGAYAVAVHFEPDTYGAVDGISIALNSSAGIDDGAGLLLGMLGSLGNRERADWLARDDVAVAAGLCATCGDFCVEISENEPHDRPNLTDALATRNDRVLLSGALELAVIAGRIEGDVHAVERAEILDVSERLLDEACARFAPATSEHKEIGPQAAGIRRQETGYTREKEL